MSRFDLLRAIDREKLLIRFRECTPRILIVTDGNLDGGLGGFGLSGFAAAIVAGGVHGMTPIIEFRHRGSGDSIFDDLDIGRFDVLMMFGWNGISDPLDLVARDRIATFMQAGGGVFATGDHEDMGAGMCGGLPRVRSMRYWQPADTPDIRDGTRLTTNLSNSNGVFEFDDQADELPQRLYANYAIPSDYLVLAPPHGGTPSKVRQAHPLLRLPGKNRVLEVFPDHPHEGECRLPTDGFAKFTIGDEEHAEWPGAFFGPFPRHVASTMSHGNGFDTGPTGAKDSVVPRSFIALAAYNGQASGVGRVVTDATWHHYVNVNLGGMTPGGVPNQALIDIHRFYVNLASWLMPARVRRCLFPWVLHEFVLNRPIAERFADLLDRDDFSPAELIDIGRTIVDELDAVSPGMGSELFADVVDESVRNTEALVGLADDTEMRAEVGAIVAEIAAGALGMHTLATLVGLAEGTEEHDERRFGRGARRGVRRMADDVLVEHMRRAERAVKAADLAKEALG